MAEPSLDHLKKFNPDSRMFDPEIVSKPSATDVSINTCPQFACKMAEDSQNLSGLDIRSLTELLVRSSILGLHKAVAWSTISSVETGESLKNIDKIDLTVQNRVNEDVSVGKNSLTDNFDNDSVANIKDAFKDLL